MLHETAKYALLLEPMTARVYRRRQDPWTLDFMLNTEAVLQGDVIMAEAIAAEYGLERSKAGVYPRVIWDRVVSRYRN
jgi:hypothetical protein